MKFFDSLARALRNAFASPEKPAAPREPAPRSYRSPFSSTARGDGFEAGARGPPVDLSGGVKLKYEVPEEPAAAPEVPESDFAASLDDLGSLIEAKAAEEALAADQPDPHAFTAEPLDFVAPVDSFEPAAPPAAEVPLDTFEPASPVAAELPLDSFEPAVVVAPPVTASEVEAPAPAPPLVQPLPSAAQHTVALMMRVEPPRAAPPEAVEQFSTLELLDTVALLSGEEEAVKKAEEPVASESAPAAEAPAAPPGDPPAQ